MTEEYYSYSFDDAGRAAASAGGTASKPISGENGHSASPTSAPNAGGAKFVRVVDESSKSDSKSAVEVPLESNGTMRLSALVSQFPGAVGLRYKPDQASDVFRACRIEGSTIIQPESGWPGTLHVVIGSSDDRRSKDACYRCGGFGHMQDACSSPPNALKDPEASQCYGCQGKGHIKVRCPNLISRSACYRCGGFGHFSKNCNFTGHHNGMGMGMGGYGAPHPPHGGSSHGAPPYGYNRGGWQNEPSNAYSEYYGGGGSSGSSAPGYHPFGGRPDKVCYRCQTSGHEAKNCPRVSSGESSLNSCFKCGMEGHLARDCDNCYICKKSGHKSYDCPEKGERRSYGDRDRDRDRDRERSRDRD